MNAREKLEAYVQAAISSGDTGRMQRSAQHVRRQMAGLFAWSECPDDDENDPCPPHLKGLTFFTLSDAAEQLDAASLKQPEAA